MARSSTHCPIGQFPVRSIYASYFNGTTWSTTEKLNTLNPTDTVNEQDVGIDGKGNAIVVWSQSESTFGFGVQKVYVKRYNVNLGWQADELVNPDVTESLGSHIAIVVDNAGSAIMIADSSWTRFTIEPSTNTGSWSAIAQLPISLGRYFDFSVNSSNQIMLLSGTNSTGQDSIVQSMLYTPGIGWGELEDIRNDLGFGPDVELNDNGDAIAVWTDLNSGFSPSRYFIMSAFRAAGSTWSAVETIRSVPENYSSSSAQAAYDNNQNATVVWDETDTGSSGVGSNDFDGVICVKHYDQSIGWSANKQLSANRGLTSNDLIMGSNVNGSLLAMWSMIEVDQNLPLISSWYSLGKTGSDPSHTIDNCDPAGANPDLVQKPQTDNINSSSSGGGGALNIILLMCFLLITTLCRRSKLI